MFSINNFKILADLQEELRQLNQQIEIATEEAQPSVKF